MRWLDGITDSMDVSTQQNSHILGETKVEGSLLVHPSETLVHGLQSFRLEIGVKTRTRKRPSQTPACKTSRAGNSLQSIGRRQPVSPLGPGSFSLSLAREGSQAMPTPFGLEETLPSHRLLDRKSTRLNSSHTLASRMPSSA